MTAKTLDPEGGGLGGLYRLEKRTSASEDVGLREGDGLLDPISIEDENETFFIKVWKPFLNIRFLEILKAIFG